MDDLFGLLQSTISPERQLLTAVTAGLQDTLATLIELGQVDLNAQLLKQNGNTALHIACQKGFHGCARRLIQAGAHIDIRNKFGFTPLSLALQDSVECVRVIFDRGSFYTDLFLIWTAEHERNIPSWIAYSRETIVFLLIATPHLAAIGDGKMPERVHEHFLMKALPCNSPLLKVFFVTGNQLPPACMSSLVDSLSMFDRDWLKKCQSVQSLQFYARLAVRRNMNCNIHFGAKLLPLPHKLIDYMTACTDTD